MWDWRVNRVLLFLVPPEGPVWRVALGFLPAVAVIVVYGVVLMLHALVSYDEERK
jgi:hypothetical protein